jgi:hypothetical protein
MIIYERAALVNSRLADRARAGETGRMGKRWLMWKALFLRQKQGHAIWQWRAAALAARNAQEARILPVFR